MAEKPSKRKSAKISTKGASARRSNTGATESKIQPGVLLTYVAPEAHSVSVVGEFNGWDPQSHRMAKDPDGHWTITLRLAPGTYQYKFVVNEHHWVEDPASLHRVGDSYGGNNSVLHVS